MDPYWLTRPTAWGFLFHETCWRILAMVCSPGTPDVQHLFDICRSFPVDHGVLNWGHSYGGCYLNYPTTPAPGEEPQINYHPGFGS